MEEVSGIFPSLREGPNELGPLPLRTRRNVGGGHTGTQKPGPRPRRARDAEAVPEGQGTPLTARAGDAQGRRCSASCLHPGVPGSLYQENKPCRRLVKNVRFTS